MPWGLPFGAFSEKKTLQSSSTLSTCGLSTRSSLLQTPRSLRSFTHFDASSTASPSDFTRTGGCSAEGAADDDAGGAEAATEALGAATEALGAATETLGSGMAAGSEEGSSSGAGPITWEDDDEQATRNTSESDRSEGTGPPMIAAPCAGYTPLGGAAVKGWARFLMVASI